MSRVTVPESGDILVSGTRVYAGHLRTEEGIRRHREATRLRAERHNPHRVFVGRYYVGRAPTTEQASQLNQQAKEHFA